MTATYLITEQLSEKIHYDPRTIRTRLKDSVLIEGIHYIRPFGGRKILFIWETIQRDISKHSKFNGNTLPMINGGYAHG